MSLKNLDRDREITKKIIDRHEERIGRVEDEVIINKERIITLFKKGEEK
ncbi:phage protein [Streptococcus dysgalactiae]|nr:phage protein [Streptococcus dysgalactiae]